MIKRIDHFGLSVPDLEEAIEFYCSTLGFTELDRHEWANDPVEDKLAGYEETAGKLAMLRLGDVCLEVFEYASPKPETCGDLRPVFGYGTTHMAFEVDDLVAEYERLKDKGMIFTAEPIDIGEAGLCTYGRDPFGNVVKLLQFYEAK